MEEKKKNKYSYTEGQKQLNRTFKMQEIELSELDIKSQELSSSVKKNEESIQQTQSDVNDLINKVEQLKAQALQLASEQGIEIPSHLRKNINLRVEKPKIDDSPYLADEKISVTDIP